MAKDCLPRIGLLFGLITPSWCFSLGLGEVTLHSALNQPLNAEVEIVDVDKGISGDQITLKIPTEEPPIADLEVKWQERVGAKPFLHLSTKKPVNSPYVNFELAMDWHDGHVVRAYTLLLDPPKSSPVSAKTTKKSSPPVDRKEESHSVQSSVFHPKDFIYETQEGEGLYRLAMKLRPNTSVSVFKMMDEIYTANPDAFLNHDRNKLSKHYQLHIPQLGEAKSPEIEARTLSSSSLEEKPAKKKLSDELLVTKEAFERMRRQHDVIQNEMTAMNTEMEALHHQFVLQHASIEHLQSIVAQLNQKMTLKPTTSKPLFNKELLIPAVEVITQNRLVITVSFVCTALMMLFWSLFSRRSHETPEQKIEESIKEEVEKDPLFEETEVVTVAPFSQDVLAQEDETPMEAIAIQKYSGQSIDNYFSSLLVLDEEEINTKLKLAKAYVDMGDVSGARDLLDEVVIEGNRQQQQEAHTLIRAIS